MARSLKENSSHKITYMKKIAALLIFLSIGIFSTQLYAQDKTSSVKEEKTSTPEKESKTEKAVKTAVDETEKAVIKAADATEKGVTKAAKVVEKETVRAAKVVEREALKAAKKVEEAFEEDE